MSTLDDVLNYSRIGIDTAPFIYFIEEHPRYLPLLEPIYAAVDSNRLVAVTSTITVAEVLIQPLRQGANELRQQYLDFFLQSKNLFVQDIDISVAEKAATLRARHNFRLPDALQLAVAIEHGCDAFVTNDRQLKRADGLAVLVLDDLISPDDTAC